MRSASPLGLPISRFLFVFGCLILTAGCSKSKEELLVGHWQWQGDNFHFTLKSDGVCERDDYWTAYGKLPGEPLISMLRSDGTWKLERNTLTLTATANRNAVVTFEIIKIDETQMTVKGDSGETEEYINSH
jgi:hypothetical protein